MSKFVLVETIAQYRMRYVIEVQEGTESSCEELAKSVVEAESAQEFSQLYLGETFLSTKIIEKSAVLELCDKDNTYAKDWKEPKKIETFVTRKIENN